MDKRDPTLVDPSLFWFWNATPTLTEIDERLDAFIAKGFRAVYVHPMPQSFRPADFHGGMEVEYLSDAFFDLIAYTCAAISARGMKMWLYDEGGWPSGMAGGRIVQENPQFGIWTLEKQADSIRPAQLLPECPYPDLMNPAATDCFIRHTHERYRAYIGTEFGRTVRGIFTDEPRVVGRLGTWKIPWSPELPAAFKADHGYAVEEVMQELFEPFGKEGLRDSQRQYLRTLSRLIAGNYYGRIRQWCESHGLLFEGHHSGEDDYGRHGQYFGDFLRQASQYHIPGVDTIWRQVFPGQSGGNYVQLASSSAWARGQRVALSESFAVYGPGLTLEQMKWIAAFQIVRGVNKIGAMASLHSAQGPRRLSVCTDISPRNPIWSHIDLWSDFVRGAARFSMKGQPEVSVGVFYRAELAPIDQSEGFNRTREQICDRLHDQLVGWMFVGCDQLKHLPLRVLIMHVHGRLEPAEVAAIRQFLVAGGKVIWFGLGDPPVGLSHAPGFDCARDIEQLHLRDYSAVELASPVVGVRLLALREGDWHGLLFFNQGAKPVTFTFRPRHGGEVAACEFDDAIGLASFDRATGQGLQITLHPSELRAYQSAQGVTAKGEAFDCVQIVPAVGDVKVRRISSFVVADDIRQTCEFEDEPDTGLGDYSQRHPAFSGCLEVENRFSIAELPQADRVILDLGVVYYTAEVSCNSVAVGRRAWAPYWYDVTRCIRAGDNDIRIRVTNTLANQWACPQVQDEHRRKWNNMYLEKITPYLTESLHCGVVGPVALRFLKARRLAGPA